MQDFSFPQPCGIVENFIYSIGLCYNQINTDALCDSVNVGTRRLKINYSTGNYHAEEVALRMVLVMQEFIYGDLPA